MEKESPNTTHLPGSGPHQLQGTVGNSQLPSLLPHHSFALPFHRPLMDVRLTDGKIRAKSDLIERTVKTLSRQLGRRFFITLARNFGFGLNGDAFETWAHQLPFRAVDKHRNDLFQIEAIFFGQAGILEDSDGDGYYLRLKKNTSIYSTNSNLSR